MIKRTFFTLFAGVLVGATGCSSSSGGTGGGTTTHTTTTSSVTGTGGTGGTGTGGTGGTGTGGTGGTGTGGTGGTGTGGTGGTGTGGTGGMGTGGTGTGDAGGPCTTTADCPTPPNECVTATCTGGTCGTAFPALNTLTPTQVKGDCHKTVCDGNGNVLVEVDDTDAPDDNNACTTDSCNNGTAVHQPVSAGTSCGTGVCDAAGKCVQCLQPSDCGADTACKSFTCTAGTCGSSNAAAGKVASNPVVGDCKSDQCDGNGGITANAPDDTDKPADDGNQCTLDTCNAGTPVHPPAPQGTTCNQNGGSVCDGAGSCGGCSTSADCPTGGACQVPVCSSGVCGFGPAPMGVLPMALQTPGDCQQLACDGTSQMPVSTADDTDVPADDGNACTADTCNAGVPVHPNLPANTACSQGGGSFCDGKGACVQCTDASQCTAANACQTPTCTAAGACSTTPVGAGTVVANPTTGDCKSDQCDGAGNVTAGAPDATDVPPDDGNQCTTEACNAGTPVHPPAPAGTSCSQNGGTACDGAGNCVGAPTVSSVSPNDSATPTTTALASTSIAITFSHAMSPATLTAQTSVGACSGSIQVSVNDFASCVGFAAAAPAMNGTNTVATLVPAPGLLVNRLYKVRVTTAAQGAGGLALASDYTSSVGFSTLNPVSTGGVVISQVYGGGGNSGATYKNDFIELHNRGATAVSLAGWSVQYGSATGTGAWQVTNLSGSIQPGAYYLIQEAAGSGGTTSLPTPDATGGISMSASAGKVALVNVTTALSGACPTGSQIVDVVGFGSNANCSETAPTAAPSNTTAVLRGVSGCADTGDNLVDFTVGAPNPRNSTSAALVCTPAQNESGNALEADYCDTQSPLSLSVQSGMMSATVYGQIYEAGVTEGAGASSMVTAQLGYGPATSNPEYESGWTWINATYNVQSGNNDEYQASFTAPAAGTYRYVYRFSLDNGATWTYCDNNQNDGGSGSNSSLTFDFEDEAVLTVTP